MNNYIFHTPVYLKYDAFQQQDLNYLHESYLTLKNQNLLRNFNGTSLLSYDTKIESILDYFNLKEIKEKIRLYSNDYLINCNIKFFSVSFHFFPMHEWNKKCKNYFFHHVNFHLDSKDSFNSNTQK